MFDLDKWQEILATMSKNKLRTILTAFGVFWGIFMLVVLLGAGNGMQHGIEREFADEAKNSLWIWGGKTSLPYKGMKPGREVIFTNDDAQSINYQVDGVEKLAPRTFFWGEYTISYKDKNGSYQIHGVNRDYLDINGSKIAAGRNLNPLDMKERRKVMVIGKRVKEVLFGADVPLDEVVGKYVKVMVLKEKKKEETTTTTTNTANTQKTDSNRVAGIYFQVVGVFTNKAEQGRLEERSVMPITTLQSTFNLYNRVHTMALTTEKGVRVSEVQGKVRQLLAGKHQFDVKDEEAVNLNNNEENFERFMGLFDGIAAFVWFISMCTLIAGIVGVSNIMLIIIKERTKEIGIRKAIGATPFSIVSLVIQESIIITSVAGYLGFLAGVGMLELIGYFITQAKNEIRYFTYPVVNLNLIFIAIGVLVVAGALAGLFPAMKAANIKPIEALRAD
ncbi:ABC transporter permease [Xanthocytophaga agilis]|nr:ABC transporter permease [Xanthocytophaga agilis]